MSIIEKVFHYEENEITIIKCRDEIWFKAVVVATILKYTNQRKAIRDHVDPEDKRKLSELMSKSKRNDSFRLKTGPLKGNGILSPDQSMMLRQYQNNGFKILVSNDYDQIIEQIIEYFRDVRIKCSYCPRRFISPQSLRNHIKFFHKMQSVFNSSNDSNGISQTLMKCIQKDLKKCDYGI